MKEQKVKKQVTKDADVVSLVGVEQIKPERRLYKSIFKNKINRDYKEVVSLKWEAMMLIKECNENVMKHEVIAKKKLNHMTAQQQDIIREEFFKKRLEYMKDDHADKLIEVIDEMFSMRGNLKNEDIRLS